MCARTAQDYIWIKGHERNKFNLDAFEKYETAPREHGREAFYGRGKRAPFFLWICYLLVLCALNKQTHLR